MRVITVLYAAESLAGITFNRSVLSVRDVAELSRSLDPPPWPSRPRTMRGMASDRVCGLKAVLVEDPVQWPAFEQVGGVRQCPGLVPLDLSTPPVNDRQFRQFRVEVEQRP